MAGTPSTKKKVGSKTTKKPVVSARRKTAASSVAAGTAARSRKTVKLTAPAKKVPKTAKKVTKKTTRKVTAQNVVRYKCRVCGYIYSPLRGEPHNGIPAGTAFEDLPEDYVCPVCGMNGKGKVGKWGFEEWRPTRYICSVCNYVYDEKRGEPHRGIKPGTRFEDLPEDYVCPVCAADPKIKIQFGKVFKQGFEPLNV